MLQMEVGGSEKSETFKGTEKMGRWEDDWNVMQWLFKETNWAFFE